uniref:SGNH/GDSL hydrolase family protein n=1 Tax=Nonomuraea pusilla TaxID=46177 RepID=UPI0006E38642|nr:SGNH/GDSL hydrolase family protein [Nonomuraea pusilla]
MRRAGPREAGPGRARAGGRRRAAVSAALAAVLGAGAAVAGAPLGVYTTLACSALGAGCPDTAEPAGRLPRAVRLTPLQVAVAGAYVGLGDSYSSGEGVYDGAPLPGDDGGDGGRCHRATGSYVPQVAGAYRFGGGSSFLACSGATTGQLLSGQHGGPSQISRVKPGTSLVTLSIGGNDAGFTQVLTGCIVKLPWSSACVDQDADVASRIAALRPNLLTLLRELRVRAPEARIIVLGYPRPFPVSPSGRVDNLSPADQRWLNAVTRRLDDAVAGVAREFDRALAAFGAPGSVEYVDAYEAFSGHEVGTAAPYLHGLLLDMEEPAVDPRSFHPTADGYRRFAELVTRQIAAGPGRPMNNVRLAAP